MTRHRSECAFYCIVLCCKWIGLLLVSMIIIVIAGLVDDLSLITQDGVWVWVWAMIHKWACG